MKRLMIHVERAVRPIRAEESTKCDMRDELYAHLTSIYEEESQQTDDRQVALEAACRRFGEPADLTAELQALVPRTERVVAWMDASVHRRKGESVPRHALRMAAWCLFAYFVLSVLTLTTFHLVAVAGIGPRSADLSGNLALRLRVVAALGGWFVINAGIFTLIGYAMRYQVEAGLLRPRSLLVTAALCLLSASTVLLTGWGFLLSLPIEPATSVDLLPRWLVLAGLTPLGCAVVSRMAAIEWARCRPWTSLEIDGP